MKALVCIVLCMVCATPIRAQLLLKNHVESFRLSDSDGVQIWAGARNKLFQTTDAGQTWLVRYTFPSGMIRQILSLSKNESTILVTTTGNRSSGGLFISRDRGSTFARTGFLPAGLGLIESEERIYALNSANASVFVSTDEGRSWRGSSDTLAFLDSGELNCAFAFDRTHRTFYAGSTRGCIRRYTEERGWEVVFIDSFTREVPQIMVDHSREMVFAITTSVRASGLNGLLSSRDKGQTWQREPSPSNLWAMDLLGDSFLLGQFFTFDSTYPRSGVLLGNPKNKTWRGIDDLEDDIIWQVQRTASKNWIFVAGRKGLRKIRAH